MKRKVIAAVLTIGMMAMTITGCGSSSSEEVAADSATETAAEETVEEETEVEPETEVAAETESTTYRVVTASVYAPFCYLNEENELDGYDVDIMKAIDEYDDTIDFTYEWCDWASMLPGLDAGRYDLCVYELGRNEDRESMYHFGNVPYSNSAGAGIITTAEHSDWTSFEDIAAAGDAVIGCIVGSNYTEYVEAYLKENPDAFQINYYETEIDAVLEDVVNGRIDATINDGTVALEKAKVSGIEDQLQVTGYVTDPVPVWAVYPQSDLGEELSAKMDEDIKALYENGTLAEIATKWLGDDYVISSLADTEYFK